MIAIVTDSSVGYSTAEITSRGILSVVPLNYQMGGYFYEEYASDRNGDYLTRMARLSPCKTAQPALNNFIRTFQSLTDKGCDVICIVLSSALSGTPDLPLHVEPLAELAFDRTRRGHADSGECVGVGSAFPRVVFCEYAFRIAGTADVVRSDGSPDGGRNRLLERPGRAERGQTAVSARHRFYLCALQCSLAPLLLNFAPRAVPKRVAPLCPGLQFLQFPFCLRRAVSFLTDSRTGMWPSLRSLIARLLASKAANDPFEPVPFS